MSQPDEQEAMSSLAEGAQAVPAPHSAELRGKVTRISLAALHGERIAVQLTLLGREIVLLGGGTFADDPELGPVLRITFAEQPEFEVLLAESILDGQILLGGAFGCPWLIQLGAQNEPAQAANPPAGCNSV